MTQLAAPFAGSKLRRMLMDSIELAEDFAKDADGFLVTSGIIARTGIQIYTAAQVGFDDLDPGATVRVFRPYDEVCAPDALSSMASLPITLGHPGGPVNSDNAPREVVGFTGAAEIHDGRLIRTPKIQITHPAAIKAVESGTVELSAGYRYEIDRTPGVTPDGEAYDAIQRSIRGNHVALVDKGRCGPVCRLETGDALNEPCSCQTTHEENMSTKFIRDCAGVPVDFGSDQAAAAFDAMLAAKDEKLTAQAKTLDERDEKIASDAKTLAAKEAELDEMKSKLTLAEDAAKPENIEKRAAERSELVSLAKQIAPNVVIVATDDALEIKRKALVACDVDLEGKSDEYIAARFDTKSEDAPKRTVGDAARAGSVLKASQPKGDGASEAYDAYVAEGEKAWSRHLDS